MSRISAGLSGVPRSLQSFLMNMTGSGTRIPAVIVGFARTICYASFSPTGPDGQGGKAGAEMLGSAAEHDSVGAARS